MALEWEKKTSSNEEGEKVAYDERASEKVKTPKGLVEVLESHVRTSQCSSSTSTSLERGH